jgi:hypothetical protein
MSYRNLIVNPLSELPFFVRLFELRLSQAIRPFAAAFGSPISSRQSLISYNPVNLVNPVQLPF